MSKGLLGSSDFLLTNKPAGLSTHRPDHDRIGYVEWLSEKLNTELKVSHRLDKETSGALVFSKTKGGAQVLSQLFEKHEVKKEYWFVSHKKSDQKEWEQRGEVKKGARNEHPRNEEGGVPLTRFERISSEGTLYLYKAYPVTGKTHQIRIHAAQSGIPIMGDDLYGGRPFSRLMLHSYQLKFEQAAEEVLHQVEPSRLFKNLEYCKDIQLASWIVSYERREVLFPELISGDQCLRLLHDETGDLRMDKAGEVYILGWWKDEPPSESEIEKIKKFLKIVGIEKWMFQWRPRKNDEANLEVLLKSESLPEEWFFKENQCFYVGARERGHNFGLFLDQRERRLWVNQNSQGKKVLNLFSFTCGFSVSAARGGAELVVSVDTSRKYLEWGKENFIKNDLNPEVHEFRSMDSLEYLNYARKKGLTFDIIVCDPPSFSRLKNKKKTFKVEKDYESLIKACRAVLSESGVVLFSTNFEAWDYEKWKSYIGKNLKDLGFQDLISSDSQLDYEWQKQDANLKAFFLKKPCPVRP